MDSDRSFAALSPNKSHIMSEMNAPILNNSVLKTFENEEVP